MELKEVDTKIKKLYKERDDLVKPRDELTNQIVKYSKQIDKLNNQKSKIILSKKETDWKYLLNENGFGSDMVKYNGLTKKLNEIELNHNCYCSQTKQVCIQFSLYENNDEITEKVHKGLGFILPYIKSLKHKNIKPKVKLIDFMESTLSEDGSYQLAYNPETKKAMIFKIRYYRYNQVTKWDGLLNTLKYVQKNLYYQETY